MHASGDEDGLIAYHLAMRTAGAAFTRSPWLLNSHREDVIEAAVEAALSARERYDPSLGVPYSFWITQRAAGAIKDGIRQRCPVSRHDTLVNGLTPGTVPDYRRRDARSLDEVVSGRVVGPDVTLGDLIPDQRRPYDEVDNRDSARRVLAGLPPRLAFVLRAYYFHDRQQADIAAELGVTESRVSQLRTEALRQARTILGL